VSKRSVLLTCAGQRVDVVRAFREALDGLGWDGDVVAVDANPLSPALMKADRGVVVPPASSPDYVPALAELVTAHGVRAVLPLADLDNVELVAGRELLERAGAALLLPDLAVAEAMFDKYRCHQALLAAGLPSPDTWIPEELPQAPPLPLLVKRRWGYASRDIYRCDSLAEVRFFVAYAGVPVIVQRFCPGEQFSIDVLCDLQGTAVNVIPRTMIESKGGESIKGMTIKDAELIEHGRRVAETMGIVGPANIQCFREADGSLPVTDVNPRFGGGFPAPTAAGSRYPELALALANGERPEARFGDFEEGVVMTRFFSQVMLRRRDGLGLEPFGDGFAGSVEEQTVSGEA
jgi:carbamoyl-phosphate synthase large subunit